MSPLAQGLALAVLLLAPGCHSLWPFAPRELAADLGLPADVAADRGADRSVDVTPRPDLADVLDLGVDLPAGPPCVAEADAETLALYVFEGASTTEVADETGDHPGTIVGSTVTRAPGRAGCGAALGFAGGHYVEVADSPAWQLDEGAVDFWARYDTGPTLWWRRAAVSRDAKDALKPGHLTIFLACDRAMIARLQVGGESYYQCSEPISLDTWVHVGVNFGGPGGLELYVDGKRAPRTGSLWESSAGVCGPSAHECGTSTTAGIGGNNNPWVIGTSAVTSAEGKAEPVSGSMHGAVDSLRISGIRRPFGKD